MATYHITHFTPFACPKGSHVERRRLDAALLAFNRMVDEMVAGHAVLDRPCGVAAQLAARKLQREQAPMHRGVSSHRVDLMGDTVLLERLD